MRVENRYKRNNQFHLSNQELRFYCFLICVSYIKTFMAISFASIGNALIERWLP